MVNKSDKLFSEQTMFFSFISLRKMEQKHVFHLKNFILFICRLFNEAVRS
jgi:hypothetical protein